MISYKMSVYYKAELSVLECLGAASAWECLSWEGSQEIICPDEGGKFIRTLKCINLLKVRNGGNCC